MNSKNHGNIDKKSLAALALLLEKEGGGKFKKSKSFEGVVTRNLNRSRIPQGIKGIFTARYGRVKRFFIGRADRSIPIHPHEKGGEMYLGGTGGTVILENPAQEHVIHVMQPDLFTVVRAGGSHGMVLAPSTEQILFFGIKFEVD